MKVKIERIENQIVTCRIEGHDDTLVDIPQECFETAIKVNDVVETRFEYQSLKEIFRPMH